MLLSAQAWNTEKSHDGTTEELRPRRSQGVVQLTHCCLDNLLKRLILFTGYILHVNKLIKTLDVIKYVLCYIHQRFLFKKSGWYFYPFLHPPPEIKLYCLFVYWNRIEIVRCRDWKKLVVCFSSVCIGIGYDNKQSTVKPQ